MGESAIRDSFNRARTRAQIPPTRPARLQTPCPSSTVPSLESAATHYNQQSVSTFPQGKRTPFQPGISPRISTLSPMLHFLQADGTLISACIENLELLDNMKIRREGSALSNHSLTNEIFSNPRLKSGAVGSLSDWLLNPAHSTQGSHLLYVYLNHGTNTQEKNTLS